MSQEAKEVMENLFEDDYEGKENIQWEQTETFLNTEDVISKIFEDDYFDTNVNTEKTEVDNVDITKQYEPNSKFEIDGKIYETDDNGKIYKINGCELLPNNEYTISGITYKTDEFGRIISCTGKAILTQDGERDNNAQTMAGGEDRRDGDQGGHIVARILGGAKGIENMLAMRGTAINQSVYKRMENEISKEVKDGKEVQINVKVDYKEESKRPSKITVTYTIDGKETVVQFDNDEGSTDLLDSVEDKIDEDEYKDLKQEIDDANGDGANISIVSVKTKYDEDGNVIKVTVTIRDENSEHPVNEDRIFNPKEEG